MFRSWLTPLGGFLGLLALSMAIATLWVPWHVPGTGQPTTWHLWKWSLSAEEQRAWAELSALKGPITAALHTTMYVGQLASVALLGLLGAAVLWHRRRTTRGAE
jgi:hypothetical protein